EQAISLHEVDFRADLYSLGATFYALLVGEPPFASGTVTQKLLWHQMRDPTPITERRPEVPNAVSWIVARLMAKEPHQRFPSCLELAEALEPFSTGPPPVDVAEPRSGRLRGKPSPYVKGTTGQADVRTPRRPGIKSPSSRSLGTRPTETEPDRTGEERV